MTSKKQNYYIVCITQYRDQKNYWYTIPEDIFPEIQKDLDDIYKEPKFLENYSYTEQEVMDIHRKNYKEKTAIIHSLFIKLKQYKINTEGYVNIKIDFENKNIKKIFTFTLDNTVYNRNRNEPCSKA